MGKIDERLIHLKADLEELQIVSEKNKAIYEQTSKIFELIEKIDYSKPQNIEIYLKMVKEHTATELEFRRSQTAIVQRISPNTAIVLKEKLNDYEQKTRSFVKLISEIKSGIQDKTTKKVSKHSDEQDISFGKVLGPFFVFLLELKELETELSSATSLTHDCVLDMIRYLENST